MPFIRFFFIFYMLCIFNGCSTGSATMDTSQLNDEYRGYIPVRVAVFSCFDLNSFDEQSKFNNFEKEVCSNYEKFVIAGYSQQKFMRGFSPKAVDKFYKKLGADGDQQKSSFLSFVRERIVNNPKSDARHINKSLVSIDSRWKDWLIRVSNVVGHSDALLLPVISKIDIQKVYVNDVETNRIQIRIESILIDTSKAKVIWKGVRGRVFYHAQSEDLLMRELDGQSVFKEQMYQKVFHSDHWLKYPGRVAF